MGGFISKKASLDFPLRQVGSMSMPPLLVLSLLLPWALQPLHVQNPSFFANVCNSQVKPTKADIHARSHKYCSNCPSQNSIGLRNCRNMSLSRRRQRVLTKVTCGMSGTSSIMAFALVKSLCRPCTPCPSM